MRTLAIILALAACEGAPPTPMPAPVTDAEASAATAAMLCRLAQRASLDCAVQGAVARLGSSQIEAVAQVTSFLVLPAKTLGMGSQAQAIPGEVQVALSVTLKVDGVPLVTGTVDEAGSDTDLDKARVAAIEAAAQRFTLDTGIAVLDAVAGGGGAPMLAAMGLQAPAQQVEGRTVTAAWPILRGIGFDPKLSQKMGPNVASMGAALGPFLAGLPTEGRHAIQVKARLGGGGAPGPCGILPPVALTDGGSASIVPLQGEVYVNGSLVPDICALAQPVAWPLPQGGATLEWDQVFVVGPVLSP